MLPVYQGSKNSYMAFVLGDNLAHLQDCQEVFKHAAKLYCGAYKNRDVIESQLRHAAAQIDSEQFNQWIGKFAQLQRAEKRYQWQLLIQSELQSKAVWQKLFKAASEPYKKALVKLKNQWQWHSTYAHHSSESLYTLAFIVLPSYEANLNYISLALKTKTIKLDAKTQKEVQGFIKEARNFVNKTNFDLAKAMSARLMVASRQSDLSCDDICHYTVRQLQKLHVLSKDMRLVEESHGLTPEYFNNFHDFIAKVSPDDESVYLQHNISWLKADENYQSKIHRGKYLIIPKSLAPLLPKNALQRWWQRLTGKLRMDKYLQKNRYLIAQCRLLEIQKLNLQSPLSNVKSELANLKSIKKDLLQQLHSLQQQKPKGLLRFFKSRQVKRRKALEQYWATQCRILANKIIMAVRQQIERWEGQGFVEDVISFTPTQGEQIQTLNALLQDLLQQNLLTPAQIYQTHCLSERFMNIHRFNRMDSQPMADYVTELEKGILKGSGHLEPFYEYVDLIKLNNPDIWQVFQGKCQGAVEGVLAVFKDCISFFIESPTEVNDECLQQLARATVCLLKLGDNTIYSTLTKLSAPLYGYYLNQLVNRQVPTNWINHVENILLTQADLFKQSQQKDNLLQMKTLRETQDPSLLDTAKDLLQDYRKAELIQVCNRTTAELQQIQWDNIGKKVNHHPATLVCITALINKAKAEKSKTLADLHLEPFEKTLLGIHEYPAEPLRFCDKLLSLQRLQETFHDCDLSKLEQYQEELQHTKTTMNFTANSSRFLATPSFTHCDKNLQLQTPISKSTI